MYYTDQSKEGRPNEYEAKKTARIRRYGARAEKARMEAEARP